MAKNWYPIINSKCTNCLACTIACDLGLLTFDNNQINNTSPETCPENCRKCQTMCPYDAIHYFDGTTESILMAFSGNVCKCNCGEHKH